MISQAKLVILNIEENGKNIGENYFLCLILNKERN